MTINDNDNKRNNMWLDKTCRRGSLSSMIHAREHVTAKTTTTCQRILRWLSVNAMEALHDNDSISNGSR